jgi:2-polyprenyl-3-methyl-5-hydroxy-6-metoxy-1,4-benzoquinol methylase
VTTEQTWHDQHFAATVAGVVPAHIVNRYLHPARRSLYPLEKLFELCAPLAGKRVLVVGCGDTNMPVILALGGAEVSASDISKEALRVQREMGAANRVHIHTAQEDIRAMLWPDDQFDIVFVMMVLHHVPDELAQVMSEIRRILAPAGFAVISEPICLSPLMRWLRSIIPVHRELSPDERQLTPRDTQVIQPTETYYYHCFSRLRRLMPFLSLPLAILDDLFLSVPWFRRFAGIGVWKVQN